MSQLLRWTVDGADWPHRATSTFVQTPGLTWHVQRMGDGPVVLLLHGTGASAHSWRGIMPLLAEQYTVIAPDLPGHGFTRGRPAGGLTLPGMARAISDLLDTLSVRPSLIVGHSAGMAIGLQTMRDRDYAYPLVGLNAAITPFAGLAARMFPAMAKLLVLNPFVPRLFAVRARMRGETERFLTRATGSRLDAEGLCCYEILFGNSRHCAGALEMMAGWNLEDLQRGLGAIANPVLLVHSTGDTAVSMSAIRAASGRFPNAELAIVQKLGHLAHEEDPAGVVELILGFAERS